MGIHSSRTPGSHPAATARDEWEGWIVRRISEHVLELRVDGSCRNLHSCLSQHLHPLLFMLSERATGSERCLQLSRDFKVRVRDRDVAKHRPECHDLGMLLACLSTILSGAHTASDELIVVRRNELVVPASTTLYVEGVCHKVCKVSGDGDRG